MSQPLSSVQPSMPGELPRAMLPALYRMEDRHWWTRGMRAISLALLDGLDLPDGPVVEIGCGGGGFTAELARRFPQRIILGFDLHPLAVETLAARAAAVGRLHGVQADIHRLTVASQTCSLVVALDVLDQIGVEVSRVLAEVWRILRPGGWLLLRVSAHPWLRSPHDLAFGTGQRFSATLLRRLLENGDWRLQRMTYANTMLLPLVAAQRLAQRHGWLSTDSALDAPPMVDRWLRRLLEGEAWWLRRASLPSGVSLYALVQKQGDAALWGGQ